MSRFLNRLNLQTACRKSELSVGGVSRLVGGILHSFLRTADGLLNVAFQLLTRAFSLKLVRTDRLPHALLHTADRFIVEAGLSETLPIGSLLFHLGRDYRNAQGNVGAREIVPKAARGSRWPTSAKPSPTCEFLQKP